MPNVNGKKYPYTEAGIKKAEQAKNKMRKAGSSTRQNLPNPRQNAIRDALRKMGGKKY
jgi:hypothetical protein